jgi:type III restriction enzyme
MNQVVIENPIINSPFHEPARHFRFSDEGITDEIVDGRRKSSYFVPIARPRNKKGDPRQASFKTEWTQYRIEENKLVNQVRDRVTLWRKGGYPGVTPTTKRLIDYWTDPHREKKLFFCQVEALETAIYITEAAKKYNDAWMENAIRDANDAANDNGRFDPEYAEVYGVPFSFIPCSGATVDPKPGPLPTRVRALEERRSLGITFPRLMGCRYDVVGDRLTAAFSEDSTMTLSTADIPTKTENAPIVGESSIHTLDDLKRRRPNEVAFLLAKLTLEKYFYDQDSIRPWLFPQLLAIVKGWLAQCVILKDNTFPQMLLLMELAYGAADCIYRAIVASADGVAALKPILRPYDTIGSTRYFDFDTTRSVFATRADRCHISHVVADTDSWEQKMAEALEDMPEVVRYVKNHHLGFTIPYTLNGEEKNYIPDFIACIDDGRGSENLLNLVVEVTGQKKKDKEAKVAAARTLWAPAVNNHGGFGRWDFIEITDPWNSKNLIRDHLNRQP